VRKVRAKLLVIPALKEEVYKDIARISHEDRGHVREGSICKLKANGRSRSFIVRGLGNSGSGHILLDELSRQALGLEDQRSYEFEICPTGPLGMVVWACCVAEPGARIAAWLAVWSVALAIVGIGLAILPLLNSH
jgi:hypothetical protein